MGETLFGNNFSETVEAKLLDTAKYAISIVAFLGYLPLQVFNNQKFQIKWRSIVGLNPFVLLLFHFFYFLYYVTSAFKIKTNTPFIFGTTEVYVLTALGGLTTAASVSFKIWGVTSAKSTLEFWKTHCELVEKFTREGFNIWKEYNFIFLKMKTHIRNVALIYVLPTFFHAIFGWIKYWDLTAGIWQDESIYLAEKIGTSIILTLGLVVASFQFGLHVGISVWMMYFVQQYTGCYEMIFVEMSKLHLATNAGEDEMTVLTREKTISTCIRLYNAVQLQVEKFNTFFENRLVAEVLICILHILLYMFFTFSWISRGIPSMALTVLHPMVASFLELYHIGTDSTRMTLQAKLVLGEFQKSLDLDLELGSRLREKIQMLAIKMAYNPPEISPGLYFKIDRHLITSVLFGITTYLVILFEARSDDFKNI